MLGFTSQWGLEVICYNRFQQWVLGAFVNEDFELSNHIRMECPGIFAVLATSFFVFLFQK